MVNYCFVFLIIFFFFQGKTYANSPNNTIDITNASPGTPVQLNCSITSASNYSWTYKGHGSNQIEVATNFTFDIISSSSVGIYKCYADEMLVDTFNAANFSTPDIPHVGRSLTYIEGSTDGSISCFSYSYPSPSFSWSLSRSDGSKIDSLPEQGDGFSITNDNQSYSSIITFTSVSENHRGEYTCTASNTVGMNTALILLRVHQRLAPLWPFLAILVEILLIGLIMYLIRRSAAAKESTLGAPFQDSESSENSQDTRNLTVRYRNNAGISE